MKLEELVVFRFLKILIVELEKLDLNCFQKILLVDI